MVTSFQNYAYWLNTEELSDILIHLNVPCAKKRFIRKANLDKHLLRHQDSTQHECQSCRKVISKADLLEQHAKEKHNQSGGESGKRPLDDTNDEQEIQKGKLDRNDDQEDFYNIHSEKNKHGEIQNKSYILQNYASGTGG